LFKKLEIISQSYQMLKAALEHDMGPLTPDNVIMLKAVTIDVVTYVAKEVQQAYEDHKND